MEILYCGIKLATIDICFIISQKASYKGSNDLTDFESSIYESEENTKETV